MTISKKTDYALRALFCLVEHGEKTPLPVREIARRNDIPRKFLELIMLECKAAGWVRSVAGINGGYLMAKPAQAITMGEVIRYFEEMLAPISCVSVKCYARCSQEPTCRFRRVFLDIRNHTASVLDRSTLDEVFRGSPVVQTEVFGDETHRGAGI